MHPIAVRANKCLEVKGGWSHMFAQFLKMLLFGQRGFSRTGVEVKIIDVDVIIFARLEIIISDGDGLRLAFCWRGAGSFKPCLRHWNVLKRDSDLASRVDGYVEITCDDPSQFSFSVSRLEESVDKVEAGHQLVQEGRMSATAYDRLVKTEGFNYVAGGLPFDEVLRLRCNLFGCVRKDWVHSAMQDGAFNVDMHLLLDSVENGYPRAEAFCRLNWQFPKCFHKNKAVHRVFNEYRATADGTHDKLRATASECLAAYTLMRHFVDVDEMGDVDADKVASFKAMCHVLDVLQATKKMVLEMEFASDSLKTALTDWLEAHKKAYGLGHIRPKCHWLFDVAECMALDLALIDQFVIERLHLLAKPHAERIDNTSRFERSVLAGCVNSHIAEQSAAIRGNFLHGARVTSNFDIGARLASRATVDGMTISTDDLVVNSASRDVGKIVACAEQDGAFMVLVKRYALVHRMTHYSSRWRVTPTLRVWSAEGLTQD